MGGSQLPREDTTDEPVHLPSSMLRSSARERPAERRQPARERRDEPREPTFTIARRTDNELILFDEAASESWIVYPPRSGYEFLATRRRSVGTTIVEHHPWTPALEPVDHVLNSRDGCLVHGLHCRAQLAILAAARVGYDPFA